MLLAFDLVEFVGSNFTQWATYLSGLLVVLACGGLAWGVLRPSRRLESDETVSTPREQVKIR